MENKKVKNKSAFLKLAKYNKKFMIAMIISMLFATISTATVIIAPKQMQRMVDEMSKGVFSSLNIDKITSIMLFLVVLYIISSVAELFQNIITAVVTQNLARQLRYDISKKLSRLPLRFYDIQSTGNTISLMTNDIDTISQMLSQSLGSLVYGSALLLGTIYMMLTTSIALTITTIISSSIGFILIGVIMSKSQKYFVSSQSQLGKINGHIEEVYSNHNMIKTYNGREEVIKIFDDINHKMYKDNFRAQFLSGTMFPIMSFTANLGYALVFIVGVLLISLESDGITLGTITAFAFYGSLIAQPMQDLARSMGGLQQAAAASKRIFDFFDEKEMEREKNSIRWKNLEGNVEFKNVDFAYEKDKPIIKNFSLKVKSGQKVAIVGPTGAGKSTLINLLMRFYEIDSGKILIDGLDTKMASREEVANMFDMILQDTWIFSGSIRDNIVYNSKNIDDEKISEICQAVGIDHFINSLPQGIDTELNENTQLSEGQKQQITIARAMAKNSKMLILDEATSSVDTRTEKHIQDAMDSVMEGKTTFVIAHRLSTIKNADTILVLKDGSICEQGRHDELMTKNGFYAELYNSQFTD